MIFMDEGIVIDVIFVFWKAAAPSSLNPVGNEIDVKAVLLNVAVPML